MVTLSQNVSSKKANLFYKPSPTYTQVKSTGYHGRYVVGECGARCVKPLMPCACDMKCQMKCSPLPLPPTCYTWLYPDSQAPPDPASYDPTWFGPLPTPLPTNAVSTPTQDCYALNPGGKCVKRGTQVVVDDALCAPIAWDLDVFDPVFIENNNFIGAALAPYLNVDSPCTQCPSLTLKQHEFAGAVLSNPAAWRWFLYVTAQFVEDLELVLPHLTYYYLSLNGGRATFDENICLLKDALVIINSILWFA